MEETVHDLNIKVVQRNKFTTTDKYEVEGYFHLRTSMHNIMYTFFYANISEFRGGLEGVIDEGVYKKTCKICIILFGRQIISSPLMYQYWFIVVKFHHILSYMKKLK